jgi:predicted PurR-regulated permease PerM
VTTPAVAARFRFAPLLFGTLLTALLVWLVATASGVFLLLFIAIIASLFLRSVADVFVRRTGMPPSLALATAVMLTLGAIAGLVTLLVPPVVEQTRELVTVLPKYVAGLERVIGSYVQRVPQLKDYWNPDDHQVVTVLTEQVTKQAEALLPRVFSLLHIGIDLFALLVMSLYLARNPADYREWLIALFPPAHRELVRDVLLEIARDLRAWITGQLAGMLILAVLTAIGLAALGVPYWLTFGLFTGAVAIVPFFGTLVSTLLPALFVLGSDGDLVRAGLVVVLGTVIHLIESNLVLPLITQNQVKLPPVLSIMAVLVMGQLLGPVGLVVAVPILVVVTVIVRRVLVNRIYQGATDRIAPGGKPLVLRVPAPDGALVSTGTAHAVDLVALAERAPAA